MLLIPFTKLMLVGLLLSSSQAVGYGQPPRLPHVDPADVGMCAERLGEIDQMVAEGLQRGQMPGAVVLVARRGGIVYQRAFGQRQVEPDRQPMTLDTVFDLASLTKPIATATSAMKLVEQGKLSLDDPVAKHIPEFAANGKQDVTIAQLLTHQGGLVASRGKTIHKKSAGNQ